MNAQLVAIVIASIPFRVLTLFDAQGPVLISAPPRPGRVGDSLLQGNSVRTYERSTAWVKLDADQGWVLLNAETKLQVRNLITTRSGGRQTRLRVRFGRVKLLVRPMLNSSSGIVVESPHGVIRARGTTYSVVVLEKDTVIASRSGAVDVTAQEVSLTVPRDMATRIPEGQPPLPPRHIDELEEPPKVIQATVTDATLQTDPFNKVESATTGEEIATNERGEFNVPIGLSFRLINAANDSRLWRVVYP